MYSSGGQCCGYRMPFLVWIWVKLELLEVQRLFETYSVKHQCFGSCNPFGGECAAAQCSGDLIWLLCYAVLFAFEAVGIALCKGRAVLSMPMTILTYDGGCLVGTVPHPNKCSGQVDTFKFGSSISEGCPGRTKHVFQSKHKRVHIGKKSNFVSCRNNQTYNTLRSPFQASKGARCIEATNPASRQGGRQRGREAGKQGSTQASKQARKETSNF